MPLIPSKLNFLPEFDGRDSLYSSISPRRRGNKLTIRILTILPNHDRLAPIEASLSIKVLNHEKRIIEYDAVSHYWGDLNELENVIIHGSNTGVPGLEFKVPVTKNPTAALRQFRARASAHKGPLRLWIEALCINQSNAVERTHQVLDMKWIFLLATSVLVWLGESDQVVEKGLAALVDQAESYASRNTTGSALRPAHYLRTNLSPYEEAFHIKQFAAICALPYWRRGWTFQENAHPWKYIWYGKLRIENTSWHFLWAACSLYVDRMALKLSALSAGFLITPLLSISEREFFFDEKQLITTLAPFAIAEDSKFYIDLLQNTFYRTSDPRDAVFALRGMIPGLAVLELDYASTPEHVFSIATEALLRSVDDGLRKLPQWFHPQGSPQLPSWVFDFTHCNLDVNENGHENLLNKALIQGSDASAGSSMRVAQCNRTSIHVAGFIFDEILDIGRYTDGTKQPDLRWHPLLYNWLGLALDFFRITSAVQARVEDVRPSGHSHLEL